MLNVDVLVRLVLTAEHRLDVRQLLDDRLRREGRVIVGEIDHQHGGVGGPDGIEMDAENGLLVCHLGVGIWRFDSNMLPTHLISSKDHKHHHLGNLAFGGPHMKTLYITESLSGDILRAQLPVAGKKLYGHM